MIDHVASTEDEKEIAFLKSVYHHENETKVIDHAYAKEVTLCVMLGGPAHNTSAVIP